MSAPTADRPQPIMPRTPHQQLRFERQLSLLAHVTYLIVIGVLAAVVFHYSTKPTPYVLLDISEDFNQTIKLRPGTLDTTAQETLTKTYLRQYVRNRETIDHTTDDLRRKLVALFTNPDWFRVWDAYMRKRDGSGQVARYREKGLFREVRDIVVQSVPGQPNLYRAEFTAIDRRQHEEIRRTRWVAQIQAVKQPLEGPIEAIEQNPLGLTVYNYALSEVPAQ